MITSILWQVWVYVPCAMADWIRWLPSVAWLLFGVIGFGQWHIPGGVGSNPNGDMAVKDL